MTTNQLTYMQLQEQMRANRASEDLRAQQNAISEMTAAPTAAKLTAETERINAMLPQELRLSEEQIAKVAAETEKNISEDIKLRREVGDVQGATMRSSGRYLTTDKPVDLEQLSPAEKGLYIFDMILQSISNLTNYAGNVGKGLTQILDFSS